ncbi:MAG: DegV family protein [Firmicutes bacterium]|nr:DegV family protein [Bacillota bacterium]
MKPIIITDSCADLPASFYEENDVLRLKLTYTVDGVDFTDESEAEQTLAFYQKMREGAITKTSMVNVQAFYDCFEKLIPEGRPIIYIGFTSALSATFSSSVTARDMILEKYPDAKIYLVDSLCACIGQGLLPYYAVQLRDAGKSAEEIVEWVEANKLRVNHWVFVDDLKYLQRGGRLSKGEAFFGNLLSIKPLIWVDAEGRLTPYSKEKGKKKVIRAIVDKFVENVENPEEQTVFICHSDYLEGAQELAAMLREKVPNIKEIRYELIGTVIGSHTGPGILAVFFMGKDRRNQQ